MIRVIHSISEANQHNIGTGEVHLVGQVKLMTITLFGKKIYERETRFNGRELREAKVNCEICSQDFIVIHDKRAEIAQCPYCKQTTPI